MMMKIAQLLLTFVCLSVIGWNSNILAGGISCTKEQAMEAGNIVSTSKSWADLNQQFKHYGHCDDGYIAEGFSESVSVLLDEHWKDIEKLELLVKSDASFRDFLIRHIDGSVPIDRLERILKKANTQCSRSLKGLCLDIEAATYKAIKDSK